MQDMDQISDRLKAKIRERFSVDTNAIDRDSTMGDMGIDSLLMVDILLDIEADFGFSFESLDLPPNPTLGQLSEAISKSVGAAAGPKAGA
jgi:acyl carrier protein